MGGGEGGGRKGRGRGRMEGRKEGREEGKGKWGREEGNILLLSFLTSTRVS